MLPNSNIMARIVLQQSSPSADRKLIFLSKNNQVCSFIWTLGIILIYFCLSIGLTFYQRWFIQLQRFGYPLSVGLSHMIIKFLIAALIRALWQCWYRRRRVSLNLPNTLMRIAPVGFCSGVDIAFSNWALASITVSLYTMTKSTSIIFICFFALLFKLERKSWTLFLIVGMISGGLFLFTYKSTQFHLFGFLLLLLASFSSGIRWTLAQLIMQKSELGLKHPLDMIYHVQPWMFLAILPFSFGFEGKNMYTYFSTINISQDWGYILHKSFLILIGALIAFTMELAEYQVVSSLSSLTLSVAGVFKEVVTLILAVWSGDPMTRMNAVGLLLCLGGIILHVAAKASQEGVNRNKLDEETARFLTDGVSSSDEHEPDDVRDDSSTEVLFSVLNSRER